VIEAGVIEAAANEARSFAIDARCVRERMHSACVRSMQR
jgi:hypothetical protein